MRDPIRCGGRRRTCVAFIDNIESFLIDLADSLLQESKQPGFQIIVTHKQRLFLLVCSFFYHKTYSFDELPALPPTEEVAPGSSVVWVHTKCV